MMRLCGQYRLARMLEREDFRSRLEKEPADLRSRIAVSAAEAYDAVALQSGRGIGRDRAEIQSAGRPRNTARIRADVAGRA